MYPGTYPGLALVPKTSAMLVSNPSLNTGCAPHTQIKEGADQFVAGQQLMAAEMFKEGDLVDIAGKSIGKGFQGAPPPPELG